MPYAVVFLPEAAEQLVAIERYIATNATPDIARRYVDALIERCMAIAAVPHGGTPRDEIYAGLRTIAFRRRAVIAYRLSGERIEVAGIFYGGRDAARHLRR